MPVLKEKFTTRTFVAPSPEYTESLRLRNSVLREPLGLRLSPEEYHPGPEHIHLGIFSETLTKNLTETFLVGCLILSPLEKEKVRMRQVAIDPRFQRKGLGAALVKFAEKIAIQHGFKEIHLSARDTAIPFYLALNYETYGEPFEAVTILHQNMRKKL